MLEPKSADEADEDQDVEVQDKRQGKEILKRRDPNQQESILQRDRGRGTGRRNMIQNHSNIFSKHFSVNPMLSQCVLNVQQ